MCTALKWFTTTMASQEIFITLESQLTQLTTGEATTRMSTLSHMSFNQSITQTFKCFQSTPITMQLMMSLFITQFITISIMNITTLTH